MTLYSTEILIICSVQAEEETHWTEIDSIVENWRTFSTDITCSCRFRQSKVQQHQSYISEGLFGRDSQDRIYFSLRKSTGRTCVSNTYRSVIFDNPCDMNMKKSRRWVWKLHTEMHKTKEYAFYVLSDDFFLRAVRWYRAVYEKFLSRIQGRKIQCRQWSIFIGELFTSDD